MFAPRQAHDGFKIGELRGIIWILRIHALKFRQLFIKRFAHLFGQRQILSLLAQFGSVVALLFIAQFALDVLNLLAQEVFLVLLVEVLTRLVLDLLLQLRILQLTIQNG